MHCPPSVDVKEMEDMRAWLEELRVHVCVLVCAKGMCVYEDGVQCM